MSKVVLIGSDPEVFVGNNGTVLSAIGKVGGSKNEPLPVELGALQEDNVLLEFNINPASSVQEFETAIKHVLSQAENSIANFQLEVIRGLSSHIYEEELLRSFGQSAFVFGCEPDYNTWEGEVNSFPRDVNPCLRTAGGHLHIGFGHIGEVYYDIQERVGQMCDYMLGLPSLLLDGDDLRRSLYGKAGAIRYKQYGIEYRTLSNFWIFQDATIHWAYQGARAAYERVAELDSFTRVVSGQDVQNIINTNDRVSARQALAMLGLEDRIHAA